MEIAGAAPASAVIPAPLKKLLRLIPVFCDIVVPQ
jgi:hypothetical protein